MFHDLCSLITNNPFGSFIVILMLIWAVENVVKAFVNRNKPVCDCDCCVEQNQDDEEEEDE